MGEPEEPGGDRTDRPDPTRPAADGPLEPEGGWPTESRVFATLGGFALVLCVTYAWWSAAAARPGERGGPEWAGTIGLAAAAFFGLALALFLARSLRRVQQDTVALEEAADAGATDGLYLPETSPWPIGIGVGAALTAAGLSLGAWVAIPGVALLVWSLVGFAHQSRSRS